MLKLCARTKLSFKTNNQIWWKKFSPKKRTTWLQCNRVKLIAAGQLIKFRKKNKETQENDNKAEIRMERSDSDKKNFVKLLAHHRSVKEHILLKWTVIDRCTVFEYFF